MCVKILYYSLLTLLFLTPITINTHVVRQRLIALNVTISCLTLLRKLIHVSKRGVLEFSGHQRHFQVQIYVFPGKPLVQNANFPTIQCYFFAVFTCSLTFVYTNKYNFLVTSKLIYTVISIDTYQNEIIFKDSPVWPLPMMP